MEPEQTGPVFSGRAEPVPALSLRILIRSSRHGRDRAINICQGHVALKEVGAMNGRKLADTKRWSNVRSSARRPKVPAEAAADVCRRRGPDRHAISAAGV